MLGSIQMLYGSVLLLFQVVHSVHTRFYTTHDKCYLIMNMIRVKIILENILMCE